MRRRAIVRARSRRAFRPIWRSPASPGSCFACSCGAFRLALFASLLRLVCQPAVALEEPELVARRKELQPAPLGLRPDLHELAGLGRPPKLRRVLRPAAPAAGRPAPPHAR